MVFCDSEYFLHETHQAHPSMHDVLCGGNATFDVVLAHSDFDFGHNQPGFVSNTDPDFEYYQQALRVLVVLDTKMEKDLGSHITSLLSTWVLNEENKRVNFGDTFIASGGKYWKTERISLEAITETDFTGESGYSQLKLAMDEAIKDLKPDSSDQSYIILLSNGDDTDMVSSFNGVNNIHVVAIDTNVNRNQNMQDVASITRGFYVHAGDDVLQVSKVLDAFKNTFSYKDVSDWNLLYSDTVVTDTQFTVKVDSSLQSIKLAFYLQSATLTKDISITVAKGGNPATEISPIDIPTMVKTFQVGANEVGDWKFSIKPSGGSNFKARIQILGKTKENEDWVRLDCEIRKTLVKGANIGSRILARAFKGTNPIVDAEVKAIVGDSGQTINLLDDGGYPDSVAGDGIYTRLLPGGATGPVECRMETNTAKSSDTGAKQQSFAHPGFEEDYPEVVPNLKQPFCCGSNAPEPKTPKNIDNIVRISQSTLYKP